MPDFEIPASINTTQPISSVPTMAEKPDDKKDDKDKVKKDDKKEELRPRKFLNGWSATHDKLMQDWADLCMSYRFMHNKSEGIFHKKGLGINLAVIVISSIAGFANIGVQSLFEGNMEAIKLASFVIGGISLLSSMLTTVGNTLKWTALSESHRVAAIGWSKFGRQISVEIALHPNDRMDSFDFLKICRAELDRLIEQSPAIPPSVIGEFQQKFGHIKDLKRPEICGNLEHTTAYQSSQERLTRLATDAALMLRKKKETLKELVAPEMEEQIVKQVNERIESAIEERKKRLEEEIEIKKQEEEEERRFEELLLEQRKAKVQQEIELVRLKAEQELEAERKKVREEQETLERLAEERRKKVEEELELEKKRLQAEAEANAKQMQEHGATAPQLDKFAGSSFENRLSMNRVASSSRSRSVSVRRRSILADSSYLLETNNTGSHGVIHVQDATHPQNVRRALSLQRPSQQQTQQNTVIYPIQQQQQQQPENPDDEIIIISKD